MPRICGSGPSASVCRSASSGAARWPQPEVLAAYREADLFVLAAKVAADGDRDGLPNVLMEAQSQRLACIATDISGIPELIEDGDDRAAGPARRPAGAGALRSPALIRDPARRGGARRRRRAAGRARSFAMNAGIDLLARRFRADARRRRDERADARELAEAR